MAATKYSAEDLEALNEIRDVWTADADDALARWDDEERAAAAAEEFVHRYGQGVCATDSIGYAEPENRSPLEIVVDSTDGFIPLWAENVTLRWRFNPKSMTQFRDPLAAEGYLRTLLGEALLLWEDAVPVSFSEAQHAWDFEIAVSPQESCIPTGCTLARAFFPDAGRHDLLIYPTMFDQSPQEQIETMAHELGHVFGLRHFFAKIKEARWPSEVFGAHTNFSIMNYGSDSVMSEDDIRDLKNLYQGAWSGALTNINSTPIQLVRPFSTARIPSTDEPCVPVAGLRAAAL